MRLSLRDRGSPHPGLWPGQRMMRQLRLLRTISLQAPCSTTDCNPNVLPPPRCRGLVTANAYEDRHGQRGLMRQYRNGSYRHNFAVRWATPALARATCTPRCVEDPIDRANCQCLTAGYNDALLSNFLWDEAPRQHSRQIGATTWASFPPPTYRMHSDANGRFCVWSQGPWWSVSVADHRRRPSRVTNRSA